MLASPFDELAADYDRTFTRSAVGAALRVMVWERLAALCAGRERILELGCGTGEDAIWLARAGHRVVAIDASKRMIQIARAKALAAGCAERVEFHCLPMERLAELPASVPFDAAFSNFGAINCVPDVEALADRVASRLTPDAPLLLVPMGRHVPWEWAWFGARGRPGQALRRLRADGATWRGTRIVYPTPARLAHALRHSFDVARIGALGCVLPPSYAAGWLDRSPRTARVLTALERRLAHSRVCARLSDHYVIEARLRTRPSLLEPAPRALWRSAAKRITDAGHRLAGHRRYDTFRHERVAGFELIVRPTVANPRLLRTGAFFASLLDAKSVAADARVLDLGTGSGICALAAARLGAQVTAVDINPNAVDCARLNALHNGLGERVRVQEGDLFASVGAERFDLVLFNPPFVLGTPRDARDAAWRGPEGLPLRFARELGAHLAPGGAALLLLSSWGDACPRFEAELRAAGFTLSQFAVKRHLRESITVLKATR